MPVTPKKMDHQPGLELIRERGLRVTWVAKQIGIPYPHVYGALRGVTAPSADLRKRLPELLSVPLEQLFNADLLARRYTPYEKGRIHRSCPSCTCAPSK